MRSMVLVAERRASEAALASPVATALRTDFTALRYSERSPAFKRRRAAAWRALFRAEAELAMLLKFLMFFGKSPKL